MTLKKLNIKNAKIIGKVVNILLNILVFLFGLVLLISIYTSIQTRILGNKYSNFFGYSIFEVQTNSMSEAINAGDWIIVKLTKKIELKDIITYEYRGDFITHRVMEIHKGTYITRGDANNSNDKQPVDQKQIVGKVSSVFRNYGIIRKTLFNPIVLITLIITLFLFNLVLDKKGEEKEGKIVKKIKPAVLKLIEKIRGFNKKESNVNTLIDGDKKVLKEVDTNNSLLEVVVDEKIEEVANQEVIEEQKPVATKDEEVNAEEELENTIFFRVIPVVDESVDEKFNAVKEGKKKEYESLKENAPLPCNIIPVDIEELEDTPVISEELEIEPTTVEKEKKEVIGEEENIEDEKENGLTDIELKLLKNARRRNKNVIDTVMNLKVDELEDFVSIIARGNRIETNEATIKNGFIEAYIQAKYYNMYKDTNIGQELKENYHGTDKRFNEKVDIYMHIFALFVKLDKAKDNIDDSNEKNRYYKEQISRYFKDWEPEKVDLVYSKITKLQKEYNKVIKFFLKSLESKHFKLIFNKVASLKNTYVVNLNHNLSFNKVYSDYIINKTYTEGVVAEDKMSVLLTLLQEQLVIDMLEGFFNKNYIIYIPKSLYNKEKKCEGLLRMVDDEYAKEHMNVLISLEDLIEKGGLIKVFRKAGYKFALTIDEDTEFTENSRNKICLVSNIFVNKNVENEKLAPYISEDMKNLVFSENIMEKVDLGGE